MATYAKKTNRIEVDMLAGIAQSGKYKVPNNVFARHTGQNFGAIMKRYVDDVTRDLLSSSVSFNTRLHVKAIMLQNSLSAYDDFLTNMKWWKSAGEALKLWNSEAPLKDVYGSESYPIFEAIHEDQLTLLQDELTEVRQTADLFSSMYFVPTFTISDLALAAEELSKVQNVVAWHKAARDGGFIVGEADNAISKASCVAIAKHLAERLQKVPHADATTDLIAHLPGILESVASVSVSVDVDADLFNTGAVYLPFPSKNAVMKTAANYGLKGVVSLLDKPTCVRSSYNPIVEARSQELEAEVVSLVTDSKITGAPVAETLTAKGYLANVIMHMASGNCSIRSMSIPVIYSPVAPFISEIMREIYKKAFPSIKFEFVEFIKGTTSKGGGVWPLQALMDSISEAVANDRNNVLNYANSLHEIDLSVHLSEAIAKVMEKRGSYSAHVYAPIDGTQFSVRTSAESIRENGLIQFEANARADVVNKHVTKWGRGFTEAVTYCGDARPDYVLSDVPVSAINPIMKSLYEYASLQSPNITFDVSKGGAELRMTEDFKGPLPEFQNAAVAEVRLQRVLPEVPLNVETDIVVIAAQDVREPIVTPLHHAPYLVERKVIRTPTGYVSMGYSHASHATPFAKSLQKVVSVVATDLYAKYTTLGIPSVARELSYSYEVAPLKFRKRMPMLKGLGSTFAFSEAEVNSSVYAFMRHPATEQMASELFDDIQLSRLAVGSLRVNNTVSSLLDSAIEVHVKRWIDTLGASSAAFTTFKKVYGGLVTAAELKELRRDKELFTVVNMIADLMRQVVKKEESYLGVVILSKILTELTNLDVVKYDAVNTTVNTMPKGN